MGSKKFPLSNSLIEGFLYLFLTEPRSFDEITKGVIERYGKDVCKPNVKTSSGEPKYCAKIMKILKLGVQNNIYTYNESTGKCHIS